MTELDARTTPRWLQIPGLVFLLLLSAYFATAYAGALDRTPPQVVREHPYLFWLGAWQMFTTLDLRHSVLEGEAQVAGVWQPLDLDALFVYRWESGPQYARQSFWENQGNMRVMAQATCGRLRERQGIEATAVRFRVVQWGKRLGSLKQPRGKNAKTRDILEWDCSRRAPLPEGHRL